jgi:hypothetical protein
MGYKTELSGKRWTYIEALDLPAGGDVQCPDDTIEDDNENEGDSED